MKNEHFRLKKTYKKFSVSIFHFFDGKPLTKAYLINLKTWPSKDGKTTEN